MKVAKQEVAALSGSIEVLENLQVKEYWYESEISEIRSEACRVLVYERGSFTNNLLDCVFADNEKYESFDDQAMADLEKISQTLSGVPVYSVSKGCQISETELCFIRKGNTLDYLLGVPDRYHYLPGYSQPSDDYVYSYRGVDSDWFFSVQM